MKVKSIFGAALLGAMLSGCQYYAQFDNARHLENLRLGMSREQVREIMGDPVDTPYAQQDIWYYYTKTKWYDGQKTIDECTPVVFKNDKLVGWGKEYVNTQRLVKRPYERPEIEGVK